MKLARRDLRGSLKGFRIFLACLILGVAAIAGVGTLSSSITTGLKANGQVILGGDIDIRLTHRAAEEDERRWIGEQGRVAEVQTLRAMVRAIEGGKRTLSELKAIDDAYPLFGSLVLSPESGAESTAELLAKNNGIYGALVERSLSERIDLSLGSQLRLGELNFEVRGLIAAEPDKAAQGMALGPRTIISTAALQETGLIQPGSLIRYHYRIVLDPSVTVPEFYENVKTAFPDAGWRIRDASNGAPGIKRFVDRVALFLTLVGLTALVVGGVGVGNAVRAYLDGKIETIATLKCLGASSSFIFRVHYLQVLFLAIGGSLIGLAIGVVGSVFAAQFLASTLPVPPKITINAGPLLLATAYGLLTATLFTIWPLARARETPAAALFRDVVSSHRRPRPVYLVALGFCFSVLVALAVLTSEETWLSLFLWVTACSFWHERRRAPKFRHCGLPSLTSIGQARLQTVSFFPWGLVSPCL